MYTSKYTYILYLKTTMTLPNIYKFLVKDLEDVKEDESLIKNSKEMFYKMLNEIKEKASKCLNEIRKTV